MESRSMARLTFLCLVALLAVAVFTLPSHALKRIMPAPLSIPHRVALAETIVLGKVTLIEGHSVMLLETPEAKEKTEHFVAHVHIEEALKGAEGLTDLKV